MVGIAALLAKLGFCDGHDCSSAMVGMGAHSLGVKSRASAMVVVHMLG
jgi:hypothetical protein